MTTTSIHTATTSDLLSGFVKRLPAFPAPAEESTMLYNYNKLMIILQNREIAAIEPDAAMITRAHTLASQFAQITKSLIKKELTDDPFHTRYDGLQNQIEHELTGPMYLYARQWGLSVKALYYYKQSRYDKAIDLSLECVILNEYLIKTGVDTLLFRAAEQNKNIVRVLFRQQKTEEACRLTRAMLSYLFCGAGEGMYGTIFSDPQYWNRVPYVREGYAYEFFRAMVSLLMSLERNHHNGEKIFRDIFSNLQIDVSTPDRHIITEWIEIKSRFYEKDYGGFFALLHAFFETPLSKLYDVVKVSLLLDASSFAQKTDDDGDAPGYHAVIWEYIYKYLNGQYYLNTDLSSKNLVSLTD